jgi:CarboxypepD_reg-like domain
MLMCFNKLTGFTKVALIAAALIMGQPAANSQQPVANAKNEQKLPLTGTVIDAATKKPVPGVSVSVPGLSAAITDDKGNFKVNVASYDDNVWVTAEGWN